MKISEVITHLNKVMVEHGDLEVCTSENHEYWGNLQNSVDEGSFSVYNHAQPKGPKSGESEKALVING